MLLVVDPLERPAQAAELLHQRCVLGPLVFEQPRGRAGVAQISRIRHTTQVAVGGPVSIHDTAVTDRYVVVFDLPLTLSATGSVQSRPIGPGSGPAEPVFVPRTPESAEDEGWLLCLSYDRDRDASDLLILTAADITAEPEAVVHLPVRVPVGFHGNWVADTPGGD